LWCGFDEEGTIKPPPQTFNAINAQNLPPTSYQDFYDRLPKRSQDFIDFLETSGQSTVAQAMEALNVDSPKTLGGLAGSLNRWSRAAGLPIPFKQVKIDGQKGYRWVGLSFIDSEDGEKQSAKIADALPDVVDIVLLEEAVPAASKQFLDLLREKGRMSQKDVLSAFGLARAQSINKLLSPIQSYIDEHSGLSPVIEEFDGAGQRSYVYRSNDTTESQPIKDDSDGHPEKKDRPGVRIRRRPS
jgi:hypothetical protein